jgi:biotin transporter BioY
MLLLQIILSKRGLLAKRIQTQNKCGQSAQSLTILLIGLRIRDFAGTTSLAYLLKAKKKKLAFQSCLLADFVHIMDLQEVVHIHT